MFHGFPRGRTRTCLLLVCLAGALSACGNGEPAQTADVAEPQPAQDTVADDPVVDDLPDETEVPAGTEVTTPTPEQVTTTLIGTGGDKIGSVIIHPLRTGVRIDLHAEGLEPGLHAVHFHETGRCVPPDFTSAGGHYNPTGAKHGMPDSDEQMDEQDHHAGDMLNQTVNDIGMMDVQIVNRTVTLNGPLNPLVDEDGSALVIHAQEDDYSTQPAGNAGPRVACAEINALN